MTDRLAGRRAVVTGAASGIGAAIADRFVAEGARVLAVDVDAERLDELTDPLGDACRPLCADVTSTADVKGVANEVQQLWGGLDILANVAGIVGPRATLTDLTEEDFERVTAVNVGGPFRMMKYCVPLMIAAGGGSVINMASVNSFAVSPGAPVSYAASKGAIMMLTRAAAVELGPHGIRVNAICPATVKTPILSLDDTAQAHRAAQHPLGRLAHPYEVASMALFLASDEASFSTGSAFLVDGGRLSIA